MSEVTYKGNQAVPPKPRKRHTGLKVFIWTFLTIFIFIPAIAICVVYACFFDAATATIPVKEDYPSSEVFKSTLVDSFDYTKDEHKMRIRLTRDNLNQLLYNAIKDVKASSNGTIQNLFINITDKNYIFVLEVNAMNIFKTRVILTTELNVNDTEMVFQITDVAVGRIHGLNNILDLVKRFVTLPDLTEVFANTGLNIKVDLENLKLTYAIEDFTADITKMLSTNGQYGALLTEMIGNKHFRSILPYSDKALEFSLNLEAMVTTASVYGIPEYKVPAGYITSYATDACTTVKGLLDNNKISVDDASAVTKYYIVGLDHLTGSEKDRINYYIGAGKIEAATGTYDFTVANTDKLDYIVSNQLEYQVTPEPAGQGKIASGEDIIIEVTTEQIDKIFRESKIMETIISFAGKGSDDKYKDNYVAFNRVTSTIKENILFITLSVDFNGYDINLTIKTIKDNTYTEQGAVRFEIDEIYIGDQRVSADTKTMVLDLIKNNLASASFDNKLAVETVGTKTYIAINMKDAFSDDPIFSPVMSQYTINYSSESNTASEPGKFIFTAHKS